MLGQQADPGPTGHTMASLSRRPAPNTGDGLALDREQDVQSAAHARALLLRRERARYIAVLKEQHAASKPLHPCVAILVLLVRIITLERLSTWLWGDEAAVYTSVEA